MNEVEQAETGPGAPGKRRWWRRWWVWVGGIPLALVIFTAVAAEWTSRSSFCVTCHYMQPFYDSWKSSSHHDVECIKCHYPPNFQGAVKGKLRGIYQVVAYVSQAYKRSRPWAEIQDASCLRPNCHSVNIMADTTVVMYRGVRYQHAAHLEHPRRGTRLRCTSCHSQIVQGDHMVVTPSTCVLCHLRAGGVLSPAEQAAGKNGCQLCHAAPGRGMPQQHPRPENLSVTCVQCHGGTVAGDGSVARERCFSCHWDQARLAQISDPTYLHEVHITEHSIECLNCHSLVEHRVVLARNLAQVNCQGCHPNLHEAQQVLFTGHGARHVPSMPNPMFTRGVQCQSCHVYHTGVEFPQLGENVVAREQTCERCHGQGFSQLLDRWNQLLRTRVGELRAMEATVRARLPRSDTAGAALVDSARFNLDIIIAGKPVHNAVYAGVVLDSTYALLKRAAATARPRVTLPPFHVTVTTGAEKLPTACGNCHFGITQGTVKAFGKYPFSHNVHVVDQGFDCTMCHSNAEKHGTIVVRPADCADCHHTEDNRARCVICHTDQAALFLGRSPIFGDRPAPLSNVHIEQPCTACHLRNGEVVPATRQTCSRCHEAGYGNVAAEWQATTRSGLAAARANLGRVATERLTASQRETYRLARASIDALGADGSSGVHDAQRAEDILDRVGTALDGLPKQ